MPTFAVMYTAFTEDIARTLAEAGLKPVVISEAVPYIICPDRKSGGARAILPMNLRAKSIGEADSDARMYNEVLTELTRQTGERPLGVPEDRWRSRNAMMKARLLAHLDIFIPVYARNCEIRRIDKQTAADFLSASHSYGDASCRYRYGLFLKRHTGHIAEQLDNTGSAGRMSAVHGAAAACTPVAGTLVAAAEFSNARKWTKGDKTIRSFEWVRYASAAGIRVCGGMGKIMQKFISEISPDDIMSYADLEWSEGRVYEQLGFVPEGEKEPVFFRIDSRTYRRTAIKPDSAEVPGTTENEPAYYYLKNSGSRKYRLKLTDYQ